MLDIMDLLAGYTGCIFWLDLLGMLAGNASYAKLLCYLWCLLCFQCWLAIFSKLAVYAVSPCCLCWISRLGGNVVYGGYLCCLCWMADYLAWLTRLATLGGWRGWICRVASYMLGMLAKISLLAL
jgi:hypothetical protein